MAMIKYPNYHKNILIFVFFVLFFIPFLVFAAPPQETCKSDVRGYCAYSSPSEEKQKEKNSREFAAEAQSDFFVVPGIEFLNIQGGTTIGDVLIKIYTYLLGLVGLSALFMLIWGGLAYASATEGGAKEARQKISNALFGLAIALLGYLGLITINPDFVKSLDLKLQPITMQGSSGTQEFCIADSRCLDITKRCAGTWVCNADGSQKECKVPDTCKNEENLNYCFWNTVCSDGKSTPSFKDFRTPQQCEKLCNPSGLLTLASQLCQGKGEGTDVKNATCGTPK